MNPVFSDNLEEKVAERLKNLSKICFSMEYFTADFLLFFLLKNVKIWLLVGQLCTRHQIKAFQEFSQNFPISCDPQS